MEKFRPVSLTRHFNSPARLPQRAGGGMPGWDALIEERLEYMPRGNQTYWGIPFRLGPKDLDAKGVILVARKVEPVEVRLPSSATHICVVHFCDNRLAAESSSDPRDRSCMS